MKVTDLFTADRAWVGAHKSSSQRGFGYGNCMCCHDVGQSQGLKAMAEWKDGFSHCESCWLGSEKLTGICEADGARFRLARLAIGEQVFIIVQTILLKLAI